MPRSTHIRALGLLLAGILFTATEPISVHAQQGYWELFGAEAGLSQQTAQAIFQDADGYLWVGTRAGLNRFDGEHFVSFGVRHGLENDWVNGITQDPEGYIWIATNNGMSRWSAASGFSNTGVRDGLPDKVVTAVVVDSAGAVWAGTPSGLARWDGRAWQVFGPSDGLQAPSVLTLAASPDGQLYVGTSAGLFRGAEAGFTQVDLRRLGSSAVGGLDVTPDGLVVLTSAGSLWTVRGDSVVASSPAPAGLVVQNLTVTASGSIWVRTNLGTTFFEEGEFSQMTVAEGLPILTVMSVFEDREGTLWAGGIGGIARFTGRAFTNYTQADGLGSNTVWQLARDRESRLWVGTTAGLSRLDEETDRWVTFTVADGLAGNFIRSVITDRWGTLWIGSQGGLTRRTEDRFEVVPGSPAFGEVYWIEEDGSGELWIATRAQGVLKSVDPVGNGRDWPIFVPVEVPGQRFSNSRILATSANEVWVSGDNGLSKWDGEAWRTFTVEDGLRANEPYFLAEDHEGHIWFGYHSSRGVSRFDGFCFTTYTSADGLSNDAVYSLGADDLGNIWVGTASGIDRFDGNRFVSFGLKDGYVGSESNAGAFLAEADGTLWLGAIGGLSHYNPAFDPSYGPPPNVVIADLTLGDEPFLPGSAVPHHRSDLSAHVHVLSSVNRAQIETRMRLMPQRSRYAWLSSIFGRSASEGRWTALNAGPIVLNNLKPRHYVLEVQARKFRGPWSESALAEFWITPPFWQRGWFLLLSILALVAGARGILKWKLRRVRAKNEALQRHIRQLEEADRVKNEFLSNMSHEIRTPIAGILGFVSVLREELDGVHREFLDLIAASASRLQRTLDAVLDLAQLSNDQLRMELSPVCVATEVSAAVAAMRPAAEEKGLSLEAVDETGGAAAWAHAEHLGRILDILIFNAVKFTDAGGVTVRVLSRDDLVCLEVVDTGIGIDADFLPRLFEPFHQASTGSTRTHEGNGLGLSITKRMVELMGGTVAVDSTLGKGSRFTVYLKCHLPDSQPPSPRRPDRPRQHPPRKRLRTFVRR